MLAGTSLYGLFSKVKIHPPLNNPEKGLIRPLPDRLTPAGRKQLGAEISEFEKVMRAIKRVIQPA